MGGALLLNQFSGDEGPVVENTPPAGGDDSTPPGDIVRPDGPRPPADALVEEPDARPFAPPAPSEDEPREQLVQGEETTPADASAESPALATSDAEIVDFVDSVVADYWELNGVTPSPRESDAKWARRVYLGVLGRIPTLEELQAFTANTNENKREQLVETLLSDSQYREEYARHWSGVWTNVLIGRGDNPDDMASRLGLQQYLRQAISREATLDTLAYELITATGAPQPGAEDFNGATNFLLAGMNDGMTLATSRTARVFLGTQVQCAQCHEHPFHEYGQDQFWQMNAFFRQMHVLGSGRDVRLVDGDFGGEGQTPDLEEAEVYYEGRDGQVHAAYPVFLDGQPIPKSGRIEEVDRRGELAKLVVDSPRFSRAMVNRLWAQFFGYGFTSSVDDMGAHSTPSHPEILDRLAKELEARDFDQKDLIRWIVLSEPYALSSRIEPANESDNPELGSAPLFTHYYARQMQPEAAYDSLRLAAHGEPVLGEFAADEAARADWLAQFLVVYGTDEGDESLHFAGSVSQSLAMMNGQLVQQATSNQPGTLLHELSTAEVEPSEKIERLFQATLARSPSSEEIAMANRLLKARQGDVSAALADMLWALLNSNEFILDH